MGIQPVKEYKKNFIWDMQISFNGDGEFFERPLKKL